MGTLNEMDFLKALQFVLRYEGGYVNHPLDSGGETNYGISTRFLKANNINKSPRTLTLEDAREIYRNYFWNPLKLERFEDYGLKLFLFDSAVNCGIRKAAEFLQEGISYFKDIVQDGVIGVQTTRLANELAANDRKCFFEMLIYARLSHYAHLVNAKSLQRAFIRGWINRVDDLRATMTTCDFGNWK